MEICTTADARSACVSSFDRRRRGGVTENLCIGNDPDKAVQADQDRRKEKTRFLKVFSIDLKDFAKLCLLSGSGKDSNQKLEQVLVRQAMDRVGEDLYSGWRTED